MTLDENMMCVAVWNYQGVIRKVCALVGFKGKPTQTKILEMYGENGVLFHFHITRTNNKQSNFQFYLNKAFENS